MSAIKITNRKFISKAKVLCVDFNECKVKIDNSDEFDGSNIVEVKIGLKDKFLLDYLKVCMDQGRVCNLETNNEYELIEGYVDVRVEKVSGDRDGNSDSDRFVIRSVVEFDSVPNEIEVDISDKKRLKDIFNSVVMENEIIGVGLECEERGEGKEKWDIRSVQFAVR